MSLLSKRSYLACSLSCFLATAAPMNAALADDASSNQEIGQLKRQVDALTAKVESLAAPKQAATPSKAPPTFTTEDGLKFASADGAFSLQIGTLQQIDYAAFNDDGTDIA
ncbi:MAG: hypothetical protein JWQ90_1780, partial [Hydrocarboniphaga sp.]|nr:hypothetical protein [Hydrocarboniphaga sp.]